MNFIDIFCGAGGLSCGLVMSGMKLITGVEIDPSAVETYNFNFNQQIKSQDIRNEEIKKQLASNQHIDLIAGGFPCQGFSLAGKRIITDPRNSLYLELLDMVNRIKPDWILMENVPGLKSMLKGKLIEKIINDFENIGYKIKWKILNSADFGVAQIRKRIIFIGNRNNKKITFPTVQVKEYKTTGDVLGQFLTWEENPEINHCFTKHTKQMSERMKALPIGESLYKNYKDGWKKIDWNKPSCTVKENHGGVNIHPILNRCMTVRELATLQSFPENFIFKGSKSAQLKQVGNAVPPLLAKAIGLEILKNAKF